MKLLWTYFKTKFSTIVMFFLFAGIMVGVWALYRMPLYAAVYPVIICAALGAVFFITGYLKTKKRHNEIRLNEDDASHLPSARTAEEADYIKIISRLQSERLQLEADSEKRYNDTVDYYTVWAHQIKTPIAAMRLTLQNEDSALSRLLNSELRRIEQYVEMVLMFLRLGSESTDYVIGLHDLDKIVRCCVKEFSGEFINRRIKLEYSPIETKVLTDEKWLSFVITQVLSNALKYTRQGSISIYLEKPKTLVIADTGIGIAPEDLPRVFEKGYTGYNGRRDKRATGIGLYLCRRVCANLHHSISAESCPDVGTKIRIDLSSYALEKE